MRLTLAPPPPLSEPANARQGPAPLDILFDETLIAARRLRAWRRMAAAADAREVAGADFLLTHIAAELADRLAVVERQFSRGLELHGATGAVAAALGRTGKIGALLRVETDPALIAPAGSAGSAGSDGLVAALSSVPAEPESQDFIVAPATLHLVNDTPGLLIQIRRALSPDGLFLGAAMAAGTLQELREVLLAAEATVSGGASPRVAPFADVRDWGALLQRAGFALPVVDVETLTVRYDTLFDLMRDLRAMGMANALVARSRRPASRRLFLEAARLYAERYGDPDGRIRATFSIVYLSGWAPHESQQKPLKPGSARMRLADALGTREKKL